mgnify:CR=1 FL=1
MIKLLPSRRALLAAAALGACAALLPAQAQTLARTIVAVKPSIVGVGSFLKTRSPSVMFSGTGFAVGDGLSIVTNAHVVPTALDAAKMETLGVVVGAGQDFRFRPARLVALDRVHDLAHLRLIDGPPLPAPERSTHSVVAGWSQSNTMRDLVEIHRAPNSLTQLPAAPHACPPTGQNPADGTSR